MEYSERQSRKRCVFTHPEMYLELTGVPSTDTDVQQAFIDILTSDVINPLEVLKVSQRYLAGIPVLIVG